MDTNNNGLEDVSSASKIVILGIYVKFPSQQGYVSFWYHILPGHDFPVHPFPFRWLMLVSSLEKRSTQKNMFLNEAL